MTADSPPEPRRETREDRLAAKLRENLRRRKAQARAKHDNPMNDHDAPPLSNPALSKERPKS